ncbi:ferrous iron transport protein B [Chengkuizengella sediminis]|uniref:ferrous iron transport protein B n=1 Tax=Chengkuizengella sediminis TaxID=1885917 RepID=UPI00138A2781|nr:ferrous iron transport protein B [Chengkuizengella sediminis]NDI35215.1 ferrous iron transport protein B [Chengkuizengella sediminis]
MSEIALFGNPNTGKTSLFNHLTGSYEYVGNWTGVTVEKKVGLLRNKKHHLIDLPGIYSMKPLSSDEDVATLFLLNDKFSKILNIIDASQLERNLHLTIQLLEFGKPMIIGLNMIDVSNQRGIQINETKLSELLEVPIHPIIARNGKGCKELLNGLDSNTSNKIESFKIDYGRILENKIDELSKLLPSDLNISKRWLAIQYFEGNEQVKKYLQSFIPEIQLQELYLDTEKQLTTTESCGSLTKFIHYKRHQHIQKITSQILVKTKTSKLTLTDRIDTVVTNKVLGIPIFLVLMYITFMLTFDWLGFPLADILDGFISGSLTNWIMVLLGGIGASAFLESLVIDGIIAGVGGVLVFVPQIFILFFAISLLEDSGYMARVAMVMDKLMEKVGLNGKAFIPMIIGFGCNVPGVMAARTIEQPKERLLTTLLTPFMSCSARLPVYALFVGAFFAKYQAFVVLSLYVLGIIIALILARIFSSVLLKNETSVFIIELPPYRVPQIRTLFRSTWDKGKGFIRKAGTIIFGGSVLIWFLSYSGPSGFDVPMNESFLAMIGGIIAPLLAPLGFGTWQAGAGLLTGFLAKEVIISTMSIIYFVPEANLQAFMATQFTPLSAFSFMVFVLLYVPCLATVVVIQKELNSKKWMAFSVFISFFIAYVLSFLIYQGGKFIGL